MPERPGSQKFCVCAGGVLFPPPPAICRSCKSESRNCKTKERRPAAKHDQAQSRDQQSRPFRRAVGGAFRPRHGELGIQQLEELLWRWFGGSGFVRAHMSDSNDWFVLC